MEWPRTILKTSNMMANRSHICFSFQPHWLRILFHRTPCAWKSETRVKGMTRGVGMCNMYTIGSILFIVYTISHTQHTLHQNPPIEIEEEQNAIKLRPIPVYSSIKLIHPPFAVAFPACHTNNKGKNRFNQIKMLAQNVTVVTSKCSSYTFNHLQWTFHI